MNGNPRKLLLGAALVCALASSGCRDQPADGGPQQTGGAVTQAGDDGLQKEAQSLFAARCAPCHGLKGGGDGPASAALDPKPRSFQDAEWQKAVTDAHIEKVIAEGGPAVGLSPLMPPNPDLRGKPLLGALRQHIRDLATAQ